MCELYVKADPILYESRSRSLRICGVVTTLRLENQFWDILSEIAEVDGMTTNQLIAKLYEEVMDYRGEVVNFASFLRVSCTRYLSQRRVQAPELSVVQRRSEYKWRTCWPHREHAAPQQARSRERRSDDGGGSGDKHPGLVFTLKRATSQSPKEKEHVWMVRS